MEANGPVRWCWCDFPTVCKIELLAETTEMPTRPREGMGRNNSATVTSGDRNKVSHDGICLPIQCLALSELVLSIRISLPKLS